MKIKIHHLQSFFVIYFFCLSALSVFAAENPKSASDANELLFFRHDGGIFSRIKAAELLIRNDGSGITTLDWRDKESEKISFRISSDELEAIKTLVYAVDFFSQPDKDKRFATDVGQSILRISVAGQKRELHFEYRPEIEPLTLCLWKLIHQGIILTDLRNKGDAYSALGAISDHLASAKVFQPKVLQEPLKEFIEKSDEQQNLLWAIEALSWIMTPEEWMGFLSTELNDSKDARKVLLLEALSSHPFTGDIPKAHRDMLCPFFLKHLRSEYRNWSQFSKEKRQAYGSVVRFLGEQRYTIATSVLVEMVEECYTDYASWLGWSLPMMAGDAIEPLKLLLDSPKANIRAPAAEVLGKILVMDQRLPNNTIPEPERKQILSRLRNTVVPKLEKLSKDDPNDWVRSAARSSLQQIERGWNN